MFAAQMNVPFVSFQVRDLKVLCVLYLQANPDFQKIITRARKNIFHADSYVFYISTRSLKITELVYGPIDPPVAQIKEHFYKILFYFQGKICDGCKAVNLL